MRTCVSAVAVLTALMVCGSHGEAQAPAAGPSPMERFLGAWELVDWRSTDAAGNVTFPHGENAGGQVTYTANGRMSAHLMRPPEDPADAPSQYIGYWGPFTVDFTAGTVTHHVIGSTQRNWIGSDQVRNFQFEGNDRLILSVGSSRLTWVRAR
jgi:hypothetical protein